MDIGKLSFTKAFSYLVMCLALMMPGFGHIYLNKHELFVSLTAFKLVSLSIFYSLPLFLMGLFLTLVMSEGKIKSDRDYRGIMNGTSLFMLMSFFSFTGVYYFMSIFLKFTIDDFFWIMYILPFATALGIIAMELVSQSSKQKKSTK